VGEVKNIREERIDARIAKGEKLRSTLSRFDTWSNPFTALGTGFDKAQHTVFNGKVRIPDPELCELFHGDDIARRVTQIYPQEMTRKGFRVGFPKDTTVDRDALSKLLVTLDVMPKFFEGLVWGRLYGGAVGVLGVNDGLEPEEPVNEDRIQSIDFINIIDKRFIQPKVWQNDPMAADFGEPIVYQINPQTTQGTVIRMSTEVHRSRLIIFPGVLTSTDKAANNDGWDNSIMQTLRPVIRDFQSNWNAVGNLVQEASVGVYKIKGLLGLLASGKKEVLLKRTQMIDTAKSVARSIIIDADEEDYSRIGAQLTELSSLLDRYMLRLAAAVEVPVTILMGQSPAGMNATGDSDFRWFFDNVTTQQTNILTPLLNKLLKLILLSSEGPTSGVLPTMWDINYHPLWASTPKEQAEVEKLTAERDKIYVDIKVLKAQEIGLSRFTNDGWRSETMIDREEREASLEAERIATANQTTEVVPLQLAPTDVAKVVTVNEARASQGLGELEGDSAEDGGLSVFQFAAKSQAGANVGQAAGEEAVEEGSAGNAPQGEGPQTQGTPPAVTNVTEGEGE